jgi:hypothetical protein
VAGARYPEEPAPTDPYETKVLKVQQLKAVFHKTKKKSGSKRSFNMEMNFSIV